MLIDDRTIKLLEIERMLAELHPVTPFGVKCKAAMKPFGREEKEQLLAELERVNIIKDLVNTQRSVFVEIRTAMRQVKDIRRSVERCIDNGVLNQVELFELKNLGYILNTISRTQKQLHWQTPPKYRVDELLWLDDILDPEHTGLKTFYIYDSYSVTLKEIRKKKTQAEQIVDCLKKEAIKKTEEHLCMPVRAIGEITASKSQTDILKKLDECHLLQRCSETYINTTYKIKPTDEMLERTKEIDALKEEETLEEAKVLEMLSRQIAVYGPELLRNMDALGEFDLLIAKAYMANAQSALMPVLTDDTRLVIKNGRHPFVEAKLKKAGREFTPISASLPQGVALITGANMGGKTVSLKMMGMLSIMVQYGLLVPAEYMETGLFDFVFLSAGDEQSIDLGLSTFGAEVKGINEILQHTDKKGLLLIDELARGTNPHEGYALSAAIIHYLLRKPCITVITTHFDGLAKNGVKHLQVAGLKNISGEITPTTLAEYMDYSLIEIEGEAQVPRDAIRISRLMGMSEEILKDAEVILGKTT